MNNTLRVFFNNQNERETVKAFLIETLKTMAGDRALLGESVSGIKDAHDCIVKAFDNLEELYGKIETISIPNSR